MKFISLTWSEGIREEESDTLERTIEQVLQRMYLYHPRALEEAPIQVRSFGNWVIPALVPDASYWGTQWYIESSYDDELQRIIAPTFLELVRQEPWQKMDPHFDLALVEQDLTDFPAPLARLRRDHYVLGASYPGTTAVMSVYRVRRLSDERVRHSALARLVRHHLGHVLGVPQFGRKEKVQRRGVEMHCTNPCVMRHAGTVDELATLAMEELEMGWPFCDLCTRDLHSVVLRQMWSWS